MSEEQAQPQNQVFQQPPQQVQEPQPPSPLASMSKAAGYEIPIEVAPLPSQGILYPLDHPLAGEQGVEIKCMTAKEEDLLTSRHLIKKGNVLSKLIESCVMNRMVDAETLLAGDRTAILVTIRITGYGDSYKARVQCPSCDHQFDNEFSLKGLKIRSLGAAPLQPHVNLFEFVAPVSKQVIHFKLLTGRDEKALSDEIESKRKLNINSGNVTTRLFHSVVSINGEKDPQDLRKRIELMPARDSKALRKYMDSIEPDIDMNQRIICPECDEEKEVEVPIGPSFFWPDE
jgi:hypothetical protein